MATLNTTLFRGVSSCKQVGGPMPELVCLPRSGPALDVPEEFGAALEFLSSTRPEPGPGQERVNQVVISFLSSMFSKGWQLASSILESPIFRESVNQVHAEGVAMLDRARSKATRSQREWNETVASALERLVCLFVFVDDTRAEKYGSEPGLADHMMRRIAELKAVNRKGIRFLGEFFSRWSLDQRSINRHFAKILENLAGLDKAVLSHQRGADAQQLLAARF